MSMRVETNQVLEASFGYFINPLVNVAMGMLLLGERLNRWQTVSVAIATVAIGIQAHGAGQRALYRAQPRHHLRALRLPAEDRQGLRRRPACSSKRCCSRRWRWATSSSPSCVMAALACHADPGTLLLLAATGAGDGAGRCCSSPSPCSGCGSAPSACCSTSRPPSSSCWRSRCSASISMARGC